MSGIRHDRGRGGHPRPRGSPGRRRHDTCGGLAGCRRTLVRLPHGGDGNRKTHLRLGRARRVGSDGGAAVRGARQRHPIKTAEQRHRRRSARVARGTRGLRPTGRRGQTRNMSARRLPAPRRPTRFPPGRSCRPSVAPPTRARLRADGGKPSGNPRLSLSAINLCEPRAQGCDGGRARRDARTRRHHIGRHWRGNGLCKVATDLRALSRRRLRGRRGVLRRRERRRNRGAVPDGHGLGSRQPTRVPFPFPSRALERGTRHAGRADRGLPEGGGGQGLRSARHWRH